MAKSLINSVKANKKVPECCCVKEITEQNILHPTAIGNSVATAIELQYIIIHGSPYLVTEEFV